MIVCEKFTKNDVEYGRYKSVNGFFIKRDGLDHMFASVVSILGSNTYTETDIPIPEPVNNITDTEAINIITGGEEA